MIFNFLISSRNIIYIFQKFSSKEINILLLFFSYIIIFLISISIFAKSSVLFAIRNADIKINSFSLIQQLEIISILSFIKVKRFSIELKRFKIFIIRFTVKFWSNKSFIKSFGILRTEKYFEIFGRIIFKYCHKFLFFNIFSVFSLS